MLIPLHEQLMYFFYVGTCACQKFREWCVLKRTPVLIFKCSIGISQLACVTIYTLRKRSKMGLFTSLASLTFVLFVTVNVSEKGENKTILIGHLSGFGPYRLPRNRPAISMAIEAFQAEGRLVDYNFE